MKKKIIQQMDEVVKSVMKSYHSDFYDIDKPRIESAEFKFPAIWLVGETSTHRLDIGNYKDRFYESEKTRYDYLRRHPYQYFFDESYYAKYHWYLITENGLRPINRQQAKAAVMDYINPAVQSWIVENGPLPKLTKIPVKLHGITISELKALIADCHAHGDDSLLECLKQFHQHCRVTSNQYVRVYYDKRYNEFSFGKYINDDCCMNGGILFHGWPETGYQANYAVQLNPRYGWSCHT